MPHPPEFNEARVLTELKGYNWKLSMMLKLPSVPIERIEKDLKLMAQVVDSIPEKHPLTRKWTAKLQRLFEKVIISGSSDLSPCIVHQIGQQNKSIEKCRAVSLVQSTSPSAYQRSLTDCRSTNPTGPMNLTIDFHFNLNYELANIAQNEAAASETTLHLSLSFNSSHPDMRRIMAAPRRSNSTEVIRQIMLDTDTEVSDDTLDYKIRKAFDKLKPINEKGNQTEGIRNLVVLLVKCRFILRAFKPKRKCLGKSIFNWAYFKLNSELAQEFKQQRKGMVFTNLITFLSKRLTKMNNLPKSYPLSLGCYYCKHPGHYIRRCPIVQITTCFNCFQMGHTRRLCTNKRIDPKHLLESL